MNQAPPRGGAHDPRLVPPYPAELLAELDAGALEDSFAAELWPRARAEPDAARVLAALATTRADLAELGRDPVTVAVPAHVAARLDAALAGLDPPVPVVADHPGPGGRIGDLDAARARRRRFAPGVAVLAAAAAAVVVGAVGFDLLGGGATVGTALPADAVDSGAAATEGGSAGAVPELSAADLGSALSLVGTRDLGPLAVEGVLAACLDANGVAAGTELLGASPVQLDGVDGVLLLLPTGTIGRVTALVVGPGCSEGDPAELARRDIGAP